MRTRFLAALLGSALAAVAADAPRVVLGSEVLAEGGFRELAGRRGGLITHPSGVNRRLESTIEVLRRAPGVKLVALFGPEHGIYGDVPAGDKVESRTDVRTGLPVHSLYGATRKPTAAMLRGLEVVVYDLQDTGARSYTFISTMGLAMEACAEAGVEFMVLDRPNPLGGIRVEGPRLLDERLRSFVSQWDVPYVYGLTCGELARMINGRGWIRKPCKLTVIPMRGWRRDLTWRDTGLPWVPASPHIPHGESPLFQVATGMLGEIGGVSIGVGYTLPFQTIAAPKVDPHALASDLNARGIAGVHFRPLTYKPYYGAFKDEVIGGVQLHVTDPAGAPLTAINYHALEALRKVAGRDLFAEAVKAGKKFDMFDKVNGTAGTREALQAGRSAVEIIAGWRAGEDAFRRERQPYLLY
ncbi:MAG: exo-beta-N-acetylmuramidase NamZ domain-containing protein [Opitutaceae bacterium]